MPVVEDLNVLAQFLARQDTAPLQGELLILVGSAVLSTVTTAAEVLGSGCVERILIAGGVGHSTPALYKNVRRLPELADIEVDGRSEAEILADILVYRHGVDRERLIVENRSTNCGANAWESKRVLTTLGYAPATMILVQDPTMQRRTHASYERAWRGENGWRFVSHAPFVPLVLPGPKLAQDEWPFDRFVSLVLGEIPRLRDYGPAGSDFIEHVDIPAEVLAVHDRLVAHFGVANRPAIASTS